MLLSSLKTKQTSDRVRELVDAALVRKKMSARQASIQVVGHDGLIRDIRAGRLPGLDKLQVLFELLDIDLHFGPASEQSSYSPPPPDEDAFAKIPLHEARLAAGAGASNHDEEIIDHLAFRRDWLRRIDVAPSKARLARVTGDSMEPTIFAGDMVLINTGRRAPPPRTRAARDTRLPPIYALTEDGEARIKRVDRAGPDQLLLISDNKMHPTEQKHIGDVTLIGRVAWWGHTVKDYP